MIFSEFGPPHETEGRSSREFLTHQILRPASQVNELPALPCRVSATPGPGKPDHVVKTGMALAWGIAHQHSELGNARRKIKISRRGLHIVTVSPGKLNHEFGRPARLAISNAKRQEIRLPLRGRDRNDFIKRRNGLSADDALSH
jgi:hypothetical protein